MLLLSDRNIYEKMLLPDFYFWAMKIALSCERP